MVRWILVFIALTSFGAFASPSVSHLDLMIQKLESVYKGLSNANETKQKVGLRLADLYSERSRKMFLADAPDINTINSDRERALFHYKSALKIAKDKKPIYIQMGHLKELGGLSGEAMAFYQKAADRETKQGSEAHFSMAEILFRQKKYSQAFENYQSALVNPQFHRGGLAEFRMSWCEYYMGKIPLAVKRVEKILKNPRLLSRAADSGSVQVDKDFQNEVTADYVRFLVDSESVSDKKISSLYELSTEKLKEQNVIYLAKELERLGQIGTAKKAWEFLIDHSTSPENRAEAQVYLVQLMYKLNDFKGVNEKLEQIHMTSLESVRCDTDTCKEFQLRLKEVVFLWHKEYRKNITEELVQAYQQLLLLVPEDSVRMSAADAAFNAKKYDVAYQTLSEYIQSAKSQGIKAEILERALLRRIEVAEVLKDAIKLEIAQNDYLEISPKKTQLSEVLYQQAYRSYESEDYKNAAEKFHKLAINPDIKPDIQSKSADLALDSLAILKDHGRIQSWSTEFSGLFVKRSPQFLTIKNKSILTQAAEAASKGKNWQEIGRALDQFDLAHASVDERVKFHKNRLIVAKNIKDLKSINYHGMELLKFPQLGVEDKSFVYNLLAWRAEMYLDFQTALKNQLAAKKINKNQNRDWLRVAMLAELSGEKSAKYWQKQLSSTTDTLEKLSICRRLSLGVESWKSLSKVCKTEIQKDPAHLMEVVLDIYSRTGDSSSRQIITKNPVFKGHAVRSFIQRKSFWEKYDRALNKARSVALDNNLKQNNLVRNIQKKDRYLTRLESLVGQQVQNGDWMVQVVAFSDLSQELKDFYTALTEMPPPEELTDAEKNQYVELLSQQAAPYLTRSNDYAGFLEKLWSDQQSIHQFQLLHADAKGKVYELVAADVQRVTKRFPERGLALVVAKKDAKSEVAGLDVVTQQQIENARLQVRDAPFDSAKIQHLMGLEKLRNNEIMVQYLTLRLNSSDLVDLQGGSDAVSR